MNQDIAGWLNLTVKDLLLRYGQAYADYCARTGMFWPKRQRGSDVS